jgi:hypothetical protein
MNTNYEWWVRNGQLVEARYAHGDGVHAKGYVFAYANRPTVHIVRPDGTELTWIADLCVPADGGSNEARNAALARRGHDGGATVAAEHLAQELAYWRGRAVEAERRLKKAADFYPDPPPEPPVGTVFLREDKVAWQRSDDGWHCTRAGCQNCPCEWLEAWEFGDIADDDLERKLP